MKLCVTIIWIFFKFDNFYTEVRWVIQIMFLFANRLHMIQKQIQNSNSMRYVDICARMACGHMCYGVDQYAGLIPYMKSFLFSFSQHLPLTLSTLFRTCMIKRNEVFIDTLSV